MKSRFSNGREFRCLLLISLVVSLSLTTACSKKDSRITKVTVAAKP